MDEKNKLYFGDNLKILREYVPDANVDLLRVQSGGGASSTNPSTFHADGNSILGTTSFSVGEVVPDGQGGVLAGWAKGANNFTTIPEAYLAHNSSSGSNEYTLPPAGWGGVNDPVTNSRFGGPDRPLVLGENGTAFALMPSIFLFFGSHGSGAVSFDIASGAVNWTWQAPPGNC